MNKTHSSSRRSAPPPRPAFKRTVLISLLAVIIFHGISYLMDLFLMTQLENQMIKDKNFEMLDWSMFVFSMTMLVLYVVVRAVLYYQDQDRRKAYIYETSVDRFGRRGALAASRWYDRFLLKETAIVLVIHGILWMPSAVARMLVDMGIGASRVSSVSDVLQSVFVGVAGLYRPFSTPWIGYAIGVCVVSLGYLVSGWIMHRKWDSSQFDY